LATLETLAVPEQTSDKLGQNKIDRFEMGLLKITALWKQGLLDSTF